jgi:TonB family protein
MSRKMGLILLLVLAALCAFGAAVLLLPPAKRLNQTDLQPRVPIERPFEVLISCEVHKQTGEAVYGDDAPVFALFAGCKPQGNFYLVAAPSTPAEACATRNRPEVAFQLTKSGEVQNVALTRGSGNPSVDRKVLQMVRDSRYPATNCGACAVFARVPVSLNCR